MDTKQLPYYSYSQYLINKYGQKVYKLPVKLELTCPNRDGYLSTTGCIFCGLEGGSFENLSNELSVRQQLQINKEKIKRKYHAEKFIAYFQNFTNTYLPLDKFKNYVLEAIHEDIVGICFSTRPDCILSEQLTFLNEIQEKHKIDITIEIGLQTVNYHTLKKINRGHGLAEFIQAILLIKRYGFRSCAHVIIGLPWDDIIDYKECAKILSVMGVEEVKIHSLYILEDTLLGQKYIRGDFDMMSKIQYERYVIEFLRLLHPNIIVQRLLARAPKENSLFCNWGTSWWKIHNEIVQIMNENHFRQGDKTGYLQGIRNNR